MASWPTLTPHFSELDRERRRIEGALHDGVQQDLVAASVSLQFALELLDNDQPAARKLLEELEQQLQDALERVRALARGIYPSLLQTHGLADALRAMDVDAALDARYPLEVEEALYFACTALSAGATRARVWDEDGAVRFEVEGRFDEGTLAHARARVAAAGGQLTVSAGGTGVTAIVPASASER
jgi:signal transduction histidine kinase